MFNTYYSYSPISFFDDRAEKDFPLSNDRFPTMALTFLLKETIGTNTKSIDRSGNCQPRKHLREAHSMSSSLPPPPLPSPRGKNTRIASTSSYNTGSSSSLPPPPNMSPSKQQSNGSTTNGSYGGGTNYAQSLARSMTIDEMRNLHRRALSEAEAKQTELVWSWHRGIENWSGAPTRLPK